MLKIVVPAWEDWDPVRQKFIYGKETKLTLEHSLIAISKWEAKYKKPYLTDKPKTAEEAMDYIKFMTIINPNKSLDEDVYMHLTQENLREIEAYIGDPMTATTFNRRNQPPSRNKVVTSEEIYFSMASFGIPFECQQWHFNRLMTLLEVAAIRNQPGKKMSNKEKYARNRSLNAANRARFHSNG